MLTSPSAPAPAPLRFIPVTDVSRRGTPTAEPRCSACNLRHLCLPQGVDDAGLERLDAMLFSRRRVRTGETLFHAGDAFQFVYAVRRGTFKSQLVTRDGSEQVTGFQVTGELLGLDGAAAGCHASSAIALEDSEVCTIPFAALGGLGGQMQHALLRKLSAEIVREHRLMILLGSMNAEERLAGFLLSFSDRMQHRGFSGSEFHLRMSRAEIGSYLGMKIETVSRMFSQFQAQGWLEVDRRHIRLLDVAGMRRAYEHSIH